MDGSLENYTIVERLGEGTSGKVLKGKVITVNIIKNLLK